MFVNSRRNRRPFNLWPMKTASRERMKERKWIIYQCDAITITNAMILLLLLLLSLLMLLFWFLLLLRLKCDKHRLSGTPTHIYRIVHTCYIWMRQFMCAVTFSAFFFLLGSPLLLSVLSIRGAERIKYLSRSAILHLHICVWTWETWYKSTSKLIVSKRLNSHEFMCVCVWRFLLLIFRLQRNKLSSNGTRAFTHSHVHICSMCGFFLFRSSSEIKYTFINRIGYYVLLFCVAKWHRHRKRVE